MRRFVITVALMLCSWSVFSQNTFDSLAAFIKEFHLSVEAGYNFLIPSATVMDSYYIPYSTEVNGFSDLQGYAVQNPWNNNSYGYFHHHQWNIAVAAESKIVKWRLAMERDYLGYEYSGATFDADYLRVALSLQFFILKRDGMHILLGPAVEWGWITRYDYTSNGISLHNPDIGQTYGVNLLFPLTFLFPIFEHSRIYLNVAGGVHLRDDHEYPYMNHWGYGPGPEAEVMSYCPLSIGVGYSFAF